MKDVLAALAISQVTPEAGQTFSHHEVTLSKDGVAGDPVQTTDDSITFEGLEAGSYIATGFSVLNNADGSTTQTDTITSEPIVVPVDETIGVLSSITLSLVPTTPATP